MKKSAKKLAALLTLAAIVFGSLGVVAPTTSKAEESEITKVKNVRQVGSDLTSSDIAWNAYKMNEEDKDDYYYEVHIADSDTDTGECKENWTKKTSTYDTSTTLYGLENGSDYYIRVIAKTMTIPRNTVTEYYDKINIVTTPSKGNKPTITSISSTSVSLAWEKTGGADYYKVMGCPVTDGEAQLLTTSKECKADVTNLSAGVTYTFYVLPVKKSATYEATNENKYNATTVATIPNTPNGMTVVNNWTWERSLVFTWNEVACDGYEVEKSDLNGANLSLTDTSKPTYEITSFSKNTFQKLRVRAYRKIGEQKYYTDWTSYRYFCKPQKATKTKQQKKKKNWVPRSKVTWRKINGATNYSIYVSTSSQKGYQKIATTKKTSYILRKYRDKKLVSGKRYYVKIVANGVFENAKVKSFSTGEYRSFLLREAKKTTK